MSPSIFSGFKLLEGGDVKIMERAINLIKMAIIMFLLYGILDQVLKIAAKLTKGKGIKTEKAFDIEEQYNKINQLENTVAKGTQTALESIRIPKGTDSDEENWTTGDGPAVAAVSNDSNKESQNKRDEIHDNRERDAIPGDKANVNDKNLISKQDSKKENTNI